MDPQKRFLASTLQGAIDADVLTMDDLYRHLNAEVLAEHIPGQVLWACLTEGMARCGLGFGSTESAPITAAEVVPITTTEASPAVQQPESPGLPIDQIGSEVPSAADPDHLSEALPADAGGDLMDMAAEFEELPPLPDGDVAIEEVDWSDDEPS